MLQALIDDLNKALDNDCFFSALSLALTLPDICGKAKYPKEKSSKKRYTDWYDEYVGACEQCPGEEGKMPYLSGEVVYQLRCSFLHQGNPNIDKNKIQEECCKIDSFVLLTEKKKDFNFLADSASSSEDSFNAQAQGNAYRCYEVNVRRLCFILSACAGAFYKENPELFNFFDFKIVDLDERYKFIRGVKNG
ncbi:MAG: hypothetical protein Q4E99_05600 [Bacillota bacterium]|nr:hypothetical protein [Bacillota bacterium]